MKNSSFFDFDKCFLSNDLWPSFINKIGIFKANLAVSSQIVKTFVGLSCVEKGMLLIYSNKLNAIQLLRDN